MFRSKQDVDRHVRNILDRIKDDKEKTSRGYQIARLYYEIGDYETSKRYLTNFLNLRENVPQAHKLLGQIYEATNQKEKAIQSFRRSIELDSNQQDLVAKVGNLFISPRVNKVERGKDKDVDNNIKNIRQLIAEKKTQQAYHIIREVESEQLYPSSIKWYEYIVDALHNIRKAIENDEVELMIYHLLSLLRLGYLQLSAHEDDKFNQTIYLLNEVLWMAENIPEKRQEWKILLEEIQAQFFYFAGIFLLKRAFSKIIPWKEIVPLVSMCYLTSCSYTCIKQMVNWSHLIKKDNKIFTNLFDLSNYRLTQAGHMLQVIDKSTATKPVLHYMHQLTATPWRKLLFECLFPSRRSAVDRESFILSSKNISHRSLVIPNTSDIFRNDEVSCHVYPDRLAEIVWIVLQKFPNGDIQSDYKLNLFPKLKYSVPDLNIVSVESLCQLDIECFLYATVRCSAIKLHEDKSNTKPFLCPPSIDDSLCTMEQVEWWKFAFCFCVNSNITDFGKMRRTLQRGLEIVRAADNHGMSIHMLVHLAHCMEVKVKDTERTDYTISQISAIRDRAYHFWYNALLLVEQIESCGSLTGASYKHLFNDDHNKTLDSNVLLKLKEEIKLAVAKRLKEDGMYEMALDYFKSIPSPWASYYSSQIYRQLGEKESGSVDQRKSYLENSLNALHLTLDRLQGDKNHELNQYLFPFMNEVELLIKQTDTDIDLEEDTNNSRYHTPQGKVDNNPNNRVYHNTSTPSNPVSSSSRRLDMSTHVQVSNPNEHHLQPSPERLDSQIRQLSHSQESLLNVVLKRNEDLVKTNLELVAGLKECMETIRELKFEMYHRSAILGGLSSAATPRSFSTIASPYPAEVLANEMMSPGYFLDQSKPGAHLITAPQHIPREIPINHNYYEENFVPPIDHNSIHMPHRRLQPNVGFNESHISHPGPHDESSVLSKLPGPGFFSPVSTINSTAHYDASKKLPLPANNLQSPVPKSNIPDSLASINILFCGKVSYCNQENVILKMISIGNLTQIVIESVSHQSTAESYNVKDIFLQSSMSPKVVTCFYRSPGQQDKILNWNFDSCEKANEFKQSLTTAISHVRTVGVSSNTTSDMPSTTQTVSQSTGFSWNTFSPSASKEQEKKTVSNSPHAHQSPTVNQTSEISKTVEANNSLEDFEPNVHFKPVIDLPDLVALTTGEESEIKIYSDRAKLYRYDSQSSQWKERGVGVFKILKSQDTNKFRFLMRRDQVLKICANHLLTKEMKLSPMTNSDKAWCWVAEDFADEEMKPEQFALRLKNKEMADKFKEEFEKCQKELKTNEVVKSKDIEHPAKPGNKTEVVPLSDVFKAKTNTWECSGCLCRNENTVKFCPACATPKPGEKPASAPKVDLDSSKFSFGSGGGFSVQTQNTKESSFFSTTTKDTGGGFSFQPKIDTKVPAEGFSFQPKSDLKESVGGFSFQQTTDPKAPAGGFSFQQVSDSNSTTGGFSFQPKPETTTKDVSVDNKKIGGGFSVQAQPTKESPFIPTDTKNALKPASVPSIGNVAKPFTFGSTGGFSFTQKTDSKEPSGGFIFQQAADSKVTTSGFSFQPTTGSKETVSGTSQPFGNIFSPVSSTDGEKNKALETKTNPVPLSDLFKAKTDRWECNGCLCQNENTVKICPACSTPKPGEKATTSVPASKFQLDSSKFSFGSGGGFAVQTQPTKDSPFVQTESKDPAKSQTIKNVLGSETCDAAQKFKDVLKDLSTEKKKEEAVKGLEKAPTSVSKPQPAFGSTDQFVFGSANKFGAKPETPAQEACPTQSKEVPKTNIFQNPFCGSGFTFSLKPTEVKEPSVATSPAKNISKAAADSTEAVTNEDMYINKEGDDSHIVFEPIIPLPEKVEVKTMEEDEDVLFNNRAKLYRFVDGEWKEKGLGVMKILEHTQTGSRRIVMRRDQIHKVCCNHRITPDLVIKPMIKSEGKALVWFAVDFSDEEEKVEQLSARFKTAEIAASFQAIFEESKQNATANTSITKASPSKDVTKAAADSTEASTNEDMYINKEGDDSHIVFEPIIPLPEKVEVKTMEEDEDELFKNRAKLYRFVDGEWKEKGLGVMKILEHTQTGSRRIVMRRDQIHKVCCNHRITPDLVIKPMIKSEGKALVWFAVDFSDEEEKVEQLSARFKTAEIAANFQAIFEESKEKAATNTSITKDDDEDKCAENEEEDDNEEDDNEDDNEEDDDVIIEETIYATEEEVEQARKYMLPDHFYLYKLKKPCPGCIGCDEGDRSVTQKASPSKKQQPIFGSTQPSFSSIASGGENIFSQDGKEKTSTFTGFSFSSDKINAEPSFSSLASGGGENVFTQFNKDKPSFQSDAPTFSSLASGGENLFTSPFNKDQPAFASNAPTFSTLASASESSFGQASKGNKPFKWSGAGQKLFNTSSNQDDDDSVHHEAGDDIHFEPIIPLPDLVEVVTGEEDWQIIFTQRSKLYRYDKSTSQWKERGTGDMKIMKHQDKDLYRLLFRREQVFKVVCNHMISSAINMNPMETSDKAWCWVAEDFSEEEGKVENFAVKFKNIELAAKFKETFDGIIATLQDKEASREQDKSLDETVTTDDDDDNNDDDNDGDNDHEEQIDVLFDKRVTIFTKVDNNWVKQGTGNLQVILNEDVNGNAINFTTDDGNSVCNHIVCQEYYITMERARKSCIWSAVDFSTGQPTMCEFKAQFSSSVSAEEFFTVFRYSLKLAADSDLSKISTNVNGED
ncbi:hypothetical protein SNE40_000924 [Patella caerulea]|uniref:E3 SUMO-protein ligase RanBP2 n=1 Tax=Patella caerulea TaxID=87958 RepID=A0AAN8KCY6_PATCE